MPGKLLFGGGLLAALAFVIWYAIGSKMSEDAGEAVPIAFAAPSKDVVMVEIAVSMFSYKNDGPRQINGRFQTKDEWVKDHFELKDASGNAVPLRRAEFAKALPSNVAGTPEFYLQADLKPGGSYAFDFIPYVDAGQRYRHQFTAPTDKFEADRVLFKPVP